MSKTSICFLVLRCIFIFQYMMTFSDAQMLRSLQKKDNPVDIIDDNNRMGEADIELSHHFFAGKKIELTNSCPQSLKIHMRYFDDAKLQHCIFDNIRQMQRISIPTENNVNIVLLSAETTTKSGWKNIFEEKCQASKPNYIR